MSIVYFDSGYGPYAAVNVQDTYTINVPRKGPTYTNFLIDSPPLQMLIKTPDSWLETLHWPRRMGSDWFQIYDQNGNEVTNGFSGRGDLKVRTDYTAHGAWSNWINVNFPYVSFKISDFFNSNNPTSPTYSGYSIRGCGLYAYHDTESGIQVRRPNNEMALICNLVFKLDAPPTFTATDVYFDTDYVYTNLTTASVDVSDIAAKYGGYITKVTLTIGGQTAELTGDATNALSSGKLSIRLNAVGTFTPTVTVTDSRGQKTVKQLSAITVQGYNAPTISFECDRTNSSGTLEDEGTYALVNAKINYTSVVSKLTKPIVKIDGVVSNDITWYTDRELTSAVNWEAYNPESPTTLYGLIDGHFSTQSSYQIGITPTDTEGEGLEITQTLPSAFYTIDFLAGGHGIAFGCPSSEEGFLCNMPTTFLQETFIDISEYQQAGTTDNELYELITTLGWSDALVNS